MLNAMRACVLLILCGCWRGGGETEATEPEPVRVKGASCEEVGANARKIIAAATDEALASRAEPLSKIILRRCGLDDWSIELRRCVAGAATVDDVDEVCERLASKPQRDALERELEKYDVTEDGQ